MANTRSRKPEGAATGHRPATTRWRATSPNTSSVPGWPRPGGRAGAPLPGHQGSALRPWGGATQRRATASDQAQPDWAIPGANRAADTWLSGAEALPSHTADATAHTHVSPIAAAPPERALIKVLVVVVPFWTSSSLSTATSTLHGWLCRSCLWPWLWGARMPAYREMTQNSRRSMLPRPGVL